jgi:hypothetical protein
VTGTVAFYDGGGATVPFCTAEVSTSAPYTATCVATYQAVGGHTIYALYSSDPNLYIAITNIAVTIGQGP